MTDRHVFDSPVGRLKATFDAEARLSSLLWTEDPVMAPRHPQAEEVERQVGEYFEGRRRDFDLPLAPKGSEFQVRVWAELQRIPFGKAISYGELAARLGDPKLSRAVGGANGANPIPIIIPCHRVIGADGGLTGYGGGMARKMLLLRLEGILPRTQEATQRALFD